MATEVQYPKMEEGEKTMVEAEGARVVTYEPVPHAEAQHLLSNRSETVVKFGIEEPKLGGKWTVGDGALEEEWTMEPPDGGWGWFVLLGATMVNVLVPGTVKSFGVLFVEFLSAFHASPSTAAWIPALCYFLYSSLGPLSSILSVKWSYRTVTLLGGSLAAAGMVISYGANSVTYLYLSYGILVGAGAGLSFPPTVYIVTSYFTRRRGLANGICMSGSALGSIVLPPALRLMLREYGYRGAVLLMGGLTLNVWAAALLFQPVERHMVKAPIDSPDSYYEDAIKYESPELNHKDDKSKSGITGAQVSPKDRRRRRLSPASSAPRIRSSHSLALQAVPEGELTDDGDRPMMYLGIGRGSVSGPAPKRSASTSSFQYMSTPFHGSTLSAFERPSDFASQLSIRSVAESVKDAVCCAVCRGKRKPSEESKPNKFFDVSLLKNPVYLIILISNCTNAISYTNFIILLPSYSISIGFDADVSAILLSIVSLLDLVGRIGGSALSDTQLLPKAYYFVGGLLISGLALIAMPLTSDYSVLACCCATFGLASGAYVGTTAIIMAERLGEEKLTSTYGISLFVNGLLQLAGPPLCGLWYEHSRSYSSLFMFLGAVLVSGAALWIFMPFVSKKQNDKVSS